MQASHSFPDHVLGFLYGRLQTAVIVPCPEQGQDRNMETRRNARPRGRDKRGVLKSTPPCRVVDKKKGARVDAVEKRARVVLFV